MSQLPAAVKQTRFADDSLADGADTSRSDSDLDVGVEVFSDEHEVNTLLCPTLRGKLTPRPSPLLANNNHGGGFVDDQDRVSMIVRKFASSQSAGCSSQDSFFLKRRFQSFKLAENVDLADLDAVPDTKAPPDPRDLRTLSQTTYGWSPEKPLWAVRAGPRDTIYFDPCDTNVAIVTCGGLCPGLNDVVRSIVNKLVDYGVPGDNILGIRYGFRGFIDRHCKPTSLSNEVVHGIHMEGGTMLGTSRGNADIREIVRRLDIWAIDHLYVVGGNGGNAAANAIHKQCERDGVLCSVIGVPKSIDNDIQLIDKCFGFDTAVQEAQRALDAARVEASSAFRGVGIVKLMGRQSGFIAVQASLASGAVDVCLIPEVTFKLEKLYQYVEQVLDRQGYAVVCVAEGAGQHLLDCDINGKDASGNPLLKDIGPFLRKKFKEHVRDVDVKYIDPSYMIRSVKPIATDAVYCKLLAHAAVHAAFSGFTGTTVGLVNTRYVLLPSSAVIKSPRIVDPNGQLWARLRGSIGQPDLL